MSEGSRGGLGDEPFTYRKTKSGNIFISWRGQQVMILKGAKAKSFSAKLARMNPADQQLALAKITGNFKRGNER